MEAKSEDLASFSASRRWKVRDFKIGSMLVTK